MANHVYPLFKKACLIGNGPDFTSSDDIKIALIDTGVYTYSATHEFLSDIASGAIVATTPALTSKTVSDSAAFDAADPTFPTVSGAQCEAIICYFDSGDEATSRLIFYQDSDITGMPITPNGSNISLTIDAAGLFTL